MNVKKCLCTRNVNVKRAWTRQTLVAANIATEAIPIEVRRLGPHNHHRKQRNI